MARCRMTTQHEDIAMTPTPSNPGDPTWTPTAPDAQKPGVGSDSPVPHQRDDQPLKEINDPPHDQKQAGQDLRDPQGRDTAE